MLLFWLLRSLAVVLEEGALLLVVPSGFVVDRWLLADVSLFCADNLVPAGFSIDDLVDFWQQHLSHN